MVFSERTRRLIREIVTQKIRAAASLNQRSMSPSRFPKTCDSPIMKSGKRSLARSNCQEAAKSRAFPLRSMPFSANLIGYGAPLPPQFSLPSPSARRSIVGLASVKIVESFARRRGGCYPHQTPWTTLQEMTVTDRGTLSPFPWDLRHRS